MATDKSTAYIKEHSKIFGRKSEKISDYQKRMNEASMELCLVNPNLISNRGLLLEQARKKVNDSGYIYKKGKSRSKILNSEDENPPPKRRKISKEYRLQRISELQDKIKDLENRIGYKIKRREAASNNRLYNDCDELTEQISDLKCQKHQLNIELVALNQKQKKSSWYDSNRKKQVTSVEI